MMELMPQTIRQHIPLRMKYICQSRPKLVMNLAVGAMTALLKKVRQVTRHSMLLGHQ